MIKTTLLCLFISFQSYGQRMDKYEALIPSYLKVKPLIDSNNYIHDSIRVLIIDFLQVNKSKISDYFIDSTMMKKSDSLYVHLYHTRGLKKLKDSEIKNANSEWQTTTVGNPGGSLTLIYVKKENKIIGPFYSQ